jgi:dihydrodipicolinate synthase/N-acetylneuraminate lyase
MNKSDWTGVIPAMTTPFRQDMAVDLDALREQVRWLIDSGCTGVVALGSLGEGATLSLREKHDVVKTCREAACNRGWVIAGIGSLSTADAVAQAESAQAAGADGLMVLPPYAYRSDWRETKAHFSAVFAATPLSSMLYNNPVAYATDVTADQMLELAAGHSNFHAVKESSADVRRITALRKVCSDRLAPLVGVDDLVVEAVAAGAVGWIAGLANAFPQESVLLFDLARQGHSRELRNLYEWFLPLLRLDTVPKFVQLIKLVQAELGRGSARVRPPRLELAGSELGESLALIRTQLGNRLTAAL